MPAPPQPPGGRHDRGNSSTPVTGPDPQVAVPGALCPDRAWHSARHSDPSTTLARIAFGYGPCELATRRGAAAAARAAGAAPRLSQPDGGSGGTPGAPEPRIGTQPVAEAEPFGGPRDWTRPITLLDACFSPGCSTWVPPTPPSGRILRR